MRSNTRSKNSGMIASALVALLATGCASPNHFREDGPSVDAELESATARSVFAGTADRAAQRRNWQTATYTPTDAGVIEHAPTYMEDPFVDKGHGREGRNVYYVGWEDMVALGYCYPRHTLNWLMIPVSAIVTPPWTVMESDGRLSRQLLGYDHDAAPCCGAPPKSATPTDEADAPAAEIALAPE